MFYLIIKASIPLIKASDTIVNVLNNCLFDITPRTNKFI